MFLLNKKFKKIIPIVITTLLLNVSSYPIINMKTIFADASQKTDSSTDTATKEKNQELAYQAVMGVSGGFPIGNGSSYTYSSTFGYKYANVVCRPGEGGDKPTANETVSYKCMIWVNRGAAIPPVVTLSTTPSESGKQEISTSVPAARWVTNADGKGKHYEAGVVAITVKFNAYAGNTTIGGESWSDFNKNASDANNGDDTFNGTGTSSDGTSSDGNSSSSSSSSGTDLCPDGTYNCNSNPSGTGTGTGTGTSSTGTGTSSTGTDTSSTGTDTSSTGTGTSSTGTGTSSTGTGTSSTGTGTSGTTNGTLDDLINGLNDKNNNAYNSGDNDWAKSNNGNSDGTDNLDDYFKGVGDRTADDSSLNGLTDDILGVDDLINKSIPQDEAQKMIDGTLNNDGSDSSGDSNSDGDSNYGNGAYSDDYGNSNDLDSNNGSSIGDAIGSLYQDALSGLDTSDSNGENGALIGDKEDSLASKIKNILNKSTDDINGNVVANDQELFDLAKKILLDSGLSLNDIRNGNNYDKNSAYTEPSSSWDMNRISKLLRDKKVKINSQTDIQTKDPINTLSNTSNKEINQKK